MINKSIHSRGLCFTRKMKYEISFPLNLIFKSIFCENFIVSDVYYTSISLKTSNFLKNKLQVFERSDCTIT